MNKEKNRESSECFVTSLFW